MDPQTALSLLCLFFLASIAISALAIWIVGRVEIGLYVSGFIPATLAAFAIALTMFVIDFLLLLAGFSLESGWAEVIVDLMAAFIVLILASRLGKGIKTGKIWGALTAAIAIAVTTWLIHRVLGI